MPDCIFEGFGFGVPKALRPNHSGSSLLGFGLQAFIPFWERRDLRVLLVGLYGLPISAVG